jgi:hypothetical protein
MARDGLAVVQPCLYTQKGSGAAMRQLIDVMAVSLSMCSAMGILVGLNCGTLISLPLADHACHASKAQLAAWVSFNFTRQLEPSSQLRKPGAGAKIKTIGAQNACTG